MIHKINAIIPTLGNGTNKCTAVHGDAASVQAVAKVKRDAISEVRSEGKPHPAERFNAMLPIPGEFHRRMMLNQDTKDMLKTESVSQRGTLQNIITTANVKIGEFTQVCADMNYKHQCHVCRNPFEQAESLLEKV